MARPLKDPKLRMDTDIRIPVTEAQKELITQAVEDDPRGLAAWAREILLQAADKRSKQRKK